MASDRAKEITDTLLNREVECGDWLTANAPHVGQEQKHLDEGSAERAYWHYGYLVALRDVRKMLSPVN